MFDTLRRPLLRPLPVLFICAALACSGSSPAPSQSRSGGQGQSQSGGAARGGSADVGKGQSAEAAAQKLEQRRESKPNDLKGRLALAEQYYELARKALDEGKQDQYLDYLRKAQAELLEATRIDPTSPEPHTQMGIITAYLGDLDASETEFKNALRLAQAQGGRGRQAPGGTLYSNLAHIAVYQGKLNEARRFLDRAVRTGAPDDEIARIMVLASWKENDMVEARDVFENACTSSREFSDNWDGVKLPKPMKKFSDFAAVCCANPTCGPHMEGACVREKQAVSTREVQLETLRKEMEIERERRRALQEIYGKRKDLEITVDDPNAPVKNTPAEPAVSSPGSKGSAPAGASGSGTAPAKPKARP